jgi:hypothetical protein
MMNFIAIGVLLFFSVILFVIVVPKYLKGARLAKEWRKKIQNALLNGEAVLFTTASKLSLNGEDMAAYQSVVTSNEKAVILKPGKYETTGSYPQFGSNGKLIRTIDDLKLSFTAKAGREYEMGIYHYDHELAAMAVAFTMINQGEGEPETIALACVYL